ncbi:HpcH/HpaI aldolase family protein [Sporosarcina cascadiensis]|uniref:HpcH/HpaI aldolase family protein n=1 Tax=Sporosarcina cascadiensis TaxID=2660747 RepID=UPI00129A473C|nr:aldolase/citrate lyase family protein [Sporosarcina cascadiensis]
MFDNKVKTMLKNGEKTMGAFVSFYSPFVVELIGHAGFDFVLIDNEHGAFSFTEIENMIRTAELVGLTTIVRTSYDVSDVQRALDRGAKGVQVPMINTKEDAEFVVARAKFPPYGQRGVAFSVRPARYGLDAGVEYLDAADENVLVSIHIETQEAVDNFDEIISVPGIDIIFIGTSDLSVSMGYRKEGANHPEVQNTMKELFRKGKEKGIIVGTFASDEESITNAYEIGAEYIGVTVPSLIFSTLKNTVKHWEGLNDKK